MLKPWLRIYWATWILASVWVKLKPSQMENTQKPNFRDQDRDSVWSPNNTLVPGEWGSPTGHHELVCFFLWIFFFFYIYICVKIGRSWDSERFCSIGSERGERPPGTSPILVPAPYGTSSHENKQKEKEGQKHLLQRIIYLCNYF